MIYIVVLLLVAVALLMTYKAEWVLKRIFKKEQCTPRDILCIKLVALGISAVTFLLLITLW